MNTFRLTLSPFDPSARILGCSRYLLEILASIFMHVEIICKKYQMPNLPLYTAFIKQTHPSFTQPHLSLHMRPSHAVDMTPTHL